MERQLGDWRVVADNIEDYQERCGEDGPYTARVLVPVIFATHVKGRMYSYCLPLADVDEAQSILAALPADFDPQVDESWSYYRTIYGSDDFGTANEYEMMDEGERLEFDRRFGGPAF